MEFDKECGVMVERLSWDDLQSQQLSFQNSEMSLVNLQRLAIKEEMKDEEDCNYDHLSKDDLINEVKARDDRISKLEAKCNVLISKMAKERVKTTLTINKQIDEIERLNRVNKELEWRVKDLMEKSGILQFPNDELVKTEPVENDLEINGQELSLPIFMHSVRGILDKEDIIQESPVFEPQYEEEVYKTNAEIEITSKKYENIGFITRNMNPCLVPKPKYSDSAPSPKIKVENQFEMTPDTNTESDSPREPLENNININDSFLESQSVSTEGDTGDITTQSKKFRVPELNIEVKKNLDFSLDTNVESDSLEGSPENDLDDSQFEISLTCAKETDNCQHQTMELFVDPSSLSVPVCVPKVERNPIELSELTSVPMESDLREVPIAVQHNSSESKSETLEDVAPKIPEGKTSSPRSEIAGKLKKKRTTGFKYSTEYKRGLQRRNRKGEERKRFKCEQCDYACKRKDTEILDAKIIHRLGGTSTPKAAVRFQSKILTSSPNVFQESSKQINGNANVSVDIFQEDNIDSVNLIESESIKKVAKVDYVLPSGSRLNLPAKPFFDLEMDDDDVFVLTPEECAIIDGECESGFNKIGVNKTTVIPPYGVNSNKQDVNKTNVTAGLSSDEKDSPIRFNRKRKAAVIKEFTCTFPDCHRSYKCRSSLKLHEKKHRDQLYIPCRVDGCESYFGLTNERALHELRIHGVFPEGDRLPLYLPTTPNSRKGNPAYNPGRPRKRRAPKNLQRA